MSKHTPGPWEVEDYRDEGDWRSTGLIWARNKGAYHPGTAICQVRTDKFHAASPPELIEEFEANVRLISAAPALLSALKRLLHADDALADEGDAESMRSAIKAAHEAIRKAEGPITDSPNQPTPKGSKED